MSETETEINPERLRTHTLPEGIHEIGRIHILVLIVITVTFVVHRNAMVFRTARPSTPKDMAFHATAAPKLKKGTKP